MRITPSWPLFKIVTLAVFMTLLSGCQLGNRLAGLWTLNILPQTFSREESRNSFMGSPVIMAFEVEQNGQEVNGIPYQEPGPGAIYMDAGWKLFGGALTNDSVEFTVWLPNSVSPDQCGDTSNFRGQISGSYLSASSISGTYVGGDCTSEYAKERTGNIDENACTWTGIFTVSISK